MELILEVGTWLSTKLAHDQMVVVVDSDDPKVAVEALGEAEAADHAGNSKLDSGVR